MDLRTAQLLGINNLASSHLDERRTTKECLRLLVHKDSVVREGRMIGASCCRRPENNRTGRLAVLCSDCQIVEQLAALVEDTELLREKDASLREPNEQQI